MSILPSPTGGTANDVIYRYRLRAAVHMYRSRAQPLPLWRLREERTGALPGEEDSRALVAWVGFEQARLSALLEFVPIGPPEHTTIRLAEGYDLDAAGRSLLLLALHLHERGALRAWIDQGPAWSRAQVVSLLAATAGHPYLDVAFALEVAGSLYARGSGDRPSSVLRLAPHTAHTLAGMHAGSAEPSTL